MEIKNIILNEDHQKVARDFKGDKSDGKILEDALMTILVNYYKGIGTIKDVYINTHNFGGVFYCSFRLKVMGTVLPWESGTIVSPVMPRELINGMNYCLNRDGII